MSRLLNFSATSLAASAAPAIRGTEAASFVR
jgi:hypothetical protein